MKLPSVLIEQLIFLCAVIQSPTNDQSCKMSQIGQIHLCKFFEDSIRFEDKFKKMSKNVKTFKNVESVTMKHTCCNSQILGVKFRSSISICDSGSPRSARRERRSSPASCRATGQSYRARIHHPAAQEEGRSELKSIKTRQVASTSLS